MILTGDMNENLRIDLLRKMIGTAGRITSGVPRIKDVPKRPNNDEIYMRMKSVAGGTGASVARMLGVTSQAFHNQVKRGSITLKTLVKLHMHTGVSFDWLVGSWDGSADCFDQINSNSSETDKSGDHSLKKFLSLVEIYNQQSGQVELKWCLTQHQECLDENGSPIPDDFGALLSLIIRYRVEAGTPDRVKSGKRRHFQVRRVLGYVLGDPKIVRFLDAKAKKLTDVYKSEQGERPGKTEFRLHSSADECKKTFRELTDQNGLSMIEPIFNNIAWDYLIGTGSMSPRVWVLAKLKESIITMWLVS